MGFQPDDFRTWLGYAVLLRLGSVDSVDTPLSQRRNTP
jgi:hypothetical protein